MPFTEELDWNRHKFMVQSLQLEDNLTDLSKLEPIVSLDYMYNYNYYYCDEKLCFIKII